MRADRRPGFRPARLARLAREAVDTLGLDLRGRTVYTEAATGAYVVTPVLAALAGARRVTAMTRATPYGSVDDVIAQTTGVTPKTMRPPYGAFTVNQRNWAAQKWGYKVILWDVDPLDWKYRNAEHVKEITASLTAAGFKVRQLGSRSA